MSKQQPSSERRILTEKKSNDQYARQNRMYGLPNHTLEKLRIDRDSIRSIREKNQEELTLEERENLKKALDNIKSHKVPSNMDQLDVEPIIYNQFSKLVSPDQLPDFAQSFGNFIEKRYNPNYQTALKAWRDEAEKTAVDTALPNFPDEHRTIPRNLVGQQLTKFTSHALNEIINTEKQNKYKELRDRHLPPHYQPGEMLPIKLGQPALSTNIGFNGVKFAKDLKTSMGGIAVGLFDPVKNEIILNENTNNLGHDTGEVFIHEGNHAINANDPYIANSVNNFLTKLAKKKHNGTLPANTIPTIYNGMKNIISLPDFINGASYEINDFRKDKLTPHEYLAKRPDLRDAAYTLSRLFEEVPAHALQTLAMDNHPWQINEQTNPDSRKLLRRMLKDTHQKYMEYGLVDKSKEIQGDPWYQYNKQPVSQYDVPPVYREANQAILNKIAALRNPKKIQQIQPQQQLLRIQTQKPPLNNQQLQSNNLFQPQSQLGNQSPSSDLKRPLTPQQTLSPNSSPTKKILQTENAYQHEQQQNQNWNQEQEQNNVDQLINNQNQQQLARGGEVTKPRKLGLSHYLGNAHGKHEYKKGGRVSSLIQIMIAQRSPKSPLYYLMP